MQKKDVHEGTIVAIMKSYIDLILLFSDTEFDRKSTANGPGQTAIFKGRWDLGAKKAFSYDLDGAPHVAEYNIMEGVETIDNPRCNITYNLNMIEEDMIIELCKNGCSRGFC